MKDKDFSPKGKDKTYWIILNEAIALEITKGHLKWTNAQLARQAKVARSLIYYYFGKSKLNIILQACHLFGEFLAGTDQAHVQAWEEGDFNAGLKLSRRAIKKFPYLIPFYFLNRNTQNEIGELIRKYEEKGFQKRMKFITGINKSQARAIFSLQLGISTSPGLKDSDVDECFKFFKIPGSKQIASSDHL